MSPDARWARGSGLARACPPPVCYANWALADLHNKTTFARSALNCTSFNEAFVDCTTVNGRTPQNAIRAAYEMLYN